MLQSLKCNIQDKAAAIYVSVAACCSVLQCVAVCYGVLHSLKCNVNDKAAAVYVSVAACCSVLQRVAAYEGIPGVLTVCCSPLSAT